MNTLAFEKKKDMYSVMSSHEKPVYLNISLGLVPTIASVVSVILRHPFYQNTSL